VSPERETEASVSGAEVFLNIKIEAMAITGTIIRIDRSFLFIDYY